MSQYTSLKWIFLDMGCSLHILIFFRNSLALNFVRHQRVSGDALRKQALLSTTEMSTYPVYSLTALSNIHRIQRVQYLRLYNV